MKWMGGWSWGEYLEAPPEIVETIIDLINEEVEAIEALRK